ncbi:MAG: elongation factor P [Bifidobacteriaceae bacterium]|jgi:elongation factor P|nr:elongation factor P [Bifidobacteriaceae bacterium]
MATTNDIKNGTVINMDGKLWTVVEFQHVKPGKGGAFVRTKIKNVMTGKVVDKTFNAGIKVEFATVDKRQMQYLYKEGNDFVFMDTSTYDQVTVPGESAAGVDKYLLEGQEATIAFHDGVALFVDLPASVVLEIKETEPGVQGDRAQAATKPATLETGAQAQVPLFINQGEKINVDTRSGDYLSRA